MHERSVSSLADLHTLLADLAGRPDRCIVRGAIADPGRTRGARRLLHDDGGERATLVDVPRRWVALDIDSVPVPDYINRRSLFECGMEISGLLPAEFRGCAFIVQATAQHCIAEGARVRLWFWLDRPVSGGELRRWFRGCPVDFSAFTAAQICYTASPIFESGADILPKRLEIVPGPVAVSVPAPEALQPPPPPPPKPLPMPVNDRKRRYAAAALRRAAERIATTAEGNRHATIRRESSSLYRLERHGLISVAELRAVVSGAAAIAGKTDVREIESLLAWAAAHVSAAPIPEGARDGH
jgi:hypothetical protein